jgi:hypothetical protein
MLRQKSRINLIDGDLGHKFDIFEERITETMATLIEELNEHENWLNTHEIADIAALYPDVTSEEIDLADEATDRWGQTAYLIEYLNSLAELKVLYLAKSIEILIKNMFKNAYPEIRTDEVFKWEISKSILTSKGIVVSALTGYQEYISLRKISNNIKHEDDLGSSFLKLEDGRIYEALISFYNKIKSLCQEFCLELSKCIIQEVHSFPEEKLNVLTNYYYERMSDETILEFISRLKAKLK